MSEDRLFDVAVIGGGIVGLATAFQLLRSQPALSVAVIEKEAALGVHQTGHNSGVLHAGLYYAPGSLKARLCREGQARARALCRRPRHPLPPLRQVGCCPRREGNPATDGAQGARYRQWRRGLEEVGPERIRELEPHVAGIRGLWSPRTGIIDFRRVALAYADEVRARGGTIVTGARVLAVRDTPERASRDLVGRPVSRPWRDRVRRPSRRSIGPAERRRDGPRVVPFRGDYYTLGAGSSAW